MNFRGDRPPTEKEKKILTIRKKYKSIFQEFFLFFAGFQNILGTIWIFTYVTDKNQFSKKKLYVIILIQKDLQVL